MNALKAIITQGGSILIVDIPFVNKEGELWSIINDNCVADYTIVDKGIKIGWVFSC